MKIHVDKLYKDDRYSELLGLGIPFKKGSLSDRDFECLCIKDDNRNLPAQFKITSRWEDDSIRFIYARFLADLPGNKKKDFKLDNDNKKESFQGIKVKRDGNSISMQNDVLSFTVQNNSDRLFSGLCYLGQKYDAGQFEGPILTVMGKHLATVFDEFKVVETGSIYGVIEGSGRFADSTDALSLSGEGLKFTVRIAMTAGKSYLDISVRLFNCTEGDIRPDSWIFAVKSSADAELSFEKTENVSGDNVIETIGTKDLEEYDFSEGHEDLKVRTVTGRSNFKTQFKISKTGENVANTITAEKLLSEANEQFAEVLYGTFFADLTDKEKGFGVCATVYQAFQNFPKAVKADKNGVTVYLIPDQKEIAALSKADPVLFTSGMAREQRFLLHFHECDEPLYELDNRSLIYQMPDVAYVDPEVFAEAKVFPDIFLPREKQIDDVEIELIDKADTHTRCYGMLNFGDGPDPGYTDQGRGGGDLVWTNNEYDYPHAMFMMYARTGIRRFLDYARVAAMHWMDVDVCHYSQDPLLMGGQWEHTRKHTGGSVNGKGNAGVMVCSHEWVEGLLDYYHFTGDERAYDTALGIGDNVLRLLDTPMYQVAGESSARETGWALRTLTALYIETHDKKWISKCDWILSQFRSWKERYGGWLSPYTDNTTIRVGFMISVALGSLMRYYRVFPDKELKAMMVEAVDDLLENARTPQGLFYYKELPSLRRNGKNTLLLEACCIGYELTGDPSYLEAGIKTFKKATRGDDSGAGFAKKLTEDTVIVGKGAPKGFAQSFYPITSFYTMAVNANKLLD
ncbi:hypothetical protein [Butyrivibrio sp. MC2021]|uniref:hypothetical protein n=1 Tax=Butyrivibrio sp. MC2021 TaxID=1408306 RepID=UPI00055AF09B|nr:hypothetical protein [Butyrivibrio sp. MC2021]